MALNLKTVYKYLLQLTSTGSKHRHFFTVGDDFSYRRDDVLRAVVERLLF